MFAVHQVAWLLAQAQNDIPDEMGYYPQLLPLAYTYLQQAWGGINDHAARVVIPWLNVTLVLMAYVLGWRVFRSRRVGLLTAAIWSFYPHFAAWYAAGDLEIPLTLYLTGAAAFFVEAWRSERIRLAVISGMLLGGALWTKPTAGALVLGVMLAVAAWAIIVRLRWRALWPKLRIALAAGLATVPLGGMWYARNLALGHTAVVFPASYWNDLAQRSGQEFGWPLLLAALIAGGMLAAPPPGLRDRSRRVRIGLPLLALALLLLGIVPTAVNWPHIFEGDNLWQWARGDYWAGWRLHLFDWLLIAAGSGVLVWLGAGVWRAWPRERRITIGLLWALLLPYALVWFLRFSYHYRLSFAIVPLLIVQAAALIDGWLWPWLAARRIGRWAGVAAVIAACGLALAVGLEFSVKHWRDSDLPDDRAKYDEANPALMAVVHMLERYAEENGQPVVAIPGEDRLPFFFPTWDIRNDRAALPERVQDVAEADVFFDSSVYNYLLGKAGLHPNPLTAQVQIGLDYYRLQVPGGDGARWPTVLQPLPLHPDGSPTVDDGNFRYTAFAVRPEAKTAAMRPGGRREDEVIIGGFARFIGYDLVSLDWYRGDKTFLTIYWQPTEQAPPPQDYSVYIHLLDANGALIMSWDGEPLRGAYHTRWWEPGESLLDYRVLELPADLPPGPASLRIGLYDPIENRRLPVVIDGAAGGDGLTIDNRITVH